MRASLCGCDFRAFIELPSFDHSVAQVIIQLTSNSGCEYLIQQKSGAAKLFHEAGAKGATDRVTLDNTMAPT